MCECTCVRAWRACFDSLRNHKDDDDDGTAVMDEPPRRQRHAL